MRPNNDAGRTDDEQLLTPDLPPPVEGVPDPGETSNEDRSAEEQSRDDRSGDDQGGERSGEQSGSGGEDRTEGREDAGAQGSEAAEPPD